MDGLSGLEFWWMTPEERSKFKYVWPAFQDVLPNDHLPDLRYTKKVALDELVDRCAAHRWINVHRKLRLYAEASGDGETLEGPILLDLDNDNEGLNEMERLVSACQCTSRALELLQAKGIDLSEECRVFFTGRKGFHIEIRPSAVDSASRAPVVRRVWKRTGLDWQVIDNLSPYKGTNELDNARTVLDSPHDAKRINGSVNAWREGHERTIHRQMIPLPAHDIVGRAPTALVPELVRRSEEAANGAKP